MKINRNFVTDVKFPLNTISYILLFSGLGLFSFLLLVNYTNLPMTVTDVLHSANAVVFFVAAFNILGYSTISLSSWINNQYTRYLTRRWKIVSVYGIVTVMLFVINYGLLVTAKLLVGAESPFVFPNGGIHILLTVWLVELAILGLLIANKSIKSTLKLQQQAARLQQENDTARYQALQNQLNPHFLFNSLNTLIAEIEYEPRGAVIFTKNLSDVYRYVLQCQDKPLVTLGAEIEFAQAYLFLHEVRLGKCIRWEIDIADDFRESQLPPLTLQLLIENIIKHNSITANKPMAINISIDEYRLIVCNSLNARQNGESLGVGLKNLSNRCQLMLGQDIEIAQTDDWFTVKIPLQYE